MANKLRLAQGQGTSHDLIDILPTELVLLVFNYLDLSSRRYTFLLLLLGLFVVYSLTTPLVSVWVLINTGTLISCRRHYEASGRRWIQLPLKKK